MTVTQPPRPATPRPPRFRDAATAAVFVRSQVRQDFLALKYLPEDLTNMVIDTHAAGGPRIILKGVEYNWALRFSLENGERLLSENRIVVSAAAQDVLSVRVAQS